MKDVMNFKDDRRLFEAAENFFANSRYVEEFAELYTEFLEVVDTGAYYEELVDKLRELIARASPNTYEDAVKGWTPVSDRLFIMIHGDLGEE